MVYFTFTTLATVGFGDYRPWADEERLFLVIIFLSGVSIFSYLIRFVLNKLKFYNNITSKLSIFC